MMCITTHLQYMLQYYYNILEIACSVPRTEFDPRKHSCVAISLAERQPLWDSGRKLGAQLPLKHFMVGPAVPPPGLSLRRPQTAPSLYRAQGNGQLDPKPKCVHTSSTNAVYVRVMRLATLSEWGSVLNPGRFLSGLQAAGKQWDMGARRSGHPCIQIPGATADSYHDADCHAAGLRRAPLRAPRCGHPHLQ
jgi:hypothetical protein